MGVQQEVTLADIADAAGTSIVTVSNALNGRKGVSERLRNEILLLAEEMGYELKRSEKDSGQDTAYNLGVIVSEEYTTYYPSFYMDIYQKIVMAAARKNSFAVLEVFGQEAQKQGRLPELLSNETIHGIMLLGQMQKGYTRLLQEHSRVPVLFVDYYEDLPEADFIVSNGYYGMYQVTHYLIQNGYRRLAYVGDIYRTSSIMDRYMGYRRALQEQQIPLRSDWLISDRDEKGTWISIKLPEEMPEAFVCNCDQEAALLLERLGSMGYRVPEDIGVAGFDHYAGVQTPVSLVTYEVDMNALAMVSVSTLLKKIKGLPYRRGIRVVDGVMIDGSSIKKTGEGRNDE